MPSEPSDREPGVTRDGAQEALRSHVADIVVNAAALKQVPGGIAVTGHTDNVRIRTASFPSNWHLSEERAKTVREILVSNGLPAERVRAEGRADGEPVATNDTPANRALNRRVEITLFVTRGAGS